MRLPSWRHRLLFGGERCQLLLERRPALGVSPLCDDRYLGRLLRRAIKVQGRRVVTGPSRAGPRLLASRAAAAYGITGVVAVRRRDRSRVRRRAAQLVAPSRHADLHRA
jgi:hypothetical protein